MAPKSTDLSTAPRLRVITVCTGNICRSPMAELILREALRRSDLADSVIVDSAGTYSGHVGHPADTRARAALREAGYESGHIARSFNPEWIAQRDLILAMDGGHARWLRAIATRSHVSAEHIFLIRDFDPNAPAHADVEDPYYDSIEEFRTVRSQLEAANPAVIAHLRAMTVQRRH